MLTPKPIIVGFTAEASSDLWQYYEQPSPPANYKQGSDAWNSWFELKQPKLVAAIEDAAKFQKLLGHITSLFAIDLATSDTCLVPADSEKEPAVVFARWLLNRYPNAFPVYAGDRSHREVAFYGFDVKSFVRLVGMDCQRCDEAVPVGLWYRNEDCVDPYDMLTSSETRGSLSLDSVCRIVGVSLPDGYKPHADAFTDAVIAAELLIRRQLMAQSDAVSLQKTTGMLAESFTEAPTAVEDSAAATQESPDKPSNEPGRKKVKAEK